jgi:hypothetical protein
MRLTRDQARQIVHSAFYRVARQTGPMSLNEFYKTIVSDTIPPGRSPSGWDGFWWESIAAEIQSGVMARQAYIQNFTGSWLKRNKRKKWSSVIDHMGKNLGPLRP